MKNMKKVQILLLMILFIVVGQTAFTAGRGCGENPQFYYQGDPLYARGRGAPGGLARGRGTVFAPQVPPANSSAPERVGAYEFSVIGSDTFHERREYPQGLPLVRVGWPISVEAPQIVLQPLPASNSQGEKELGSGFLPREVCRLDQLSKQATESARSAPVEVSFQHPLHPVDSVMRHGSEENRKAVSTVPYEDWDDQGVAWYNTYYALKVDLMKFSKEQKGKESALKYLQLVRFLDKPFFTTKAKLAICNQLIKNQQLFSPGSKIVSLDQQVLLLCFAMKLTIDSSLELYQGFFKILNTLVQGHQEMFILFPRTEIVYQLSLAREYFRKCAVTPDVPAPEDEYIQMRSRFLKIRGLFEVVSLSGLPPELVREEQEFKSFNQMFFKK